MDLASLSPPSPNPNHRDQINLGPRSELHPSRACVPRGAAETARPAGGRVGSGALTPAVAEAPELVLLAGGHGDVVQHAEPGQAVDGQAAVVGHQGQRVALQHQQPEVPQGAQAAHHALQVRQVVEA